MADVPIFIQRNLSALVLACGLSASLAWPSSARAGEVLPGQPAPAITQSIRIAGTAFEFKEETRTAATYVAEYLPAGEQFDQFTRLFAVWGNQDGSTALSQLRAKIRFVDARKGTDPLANYKVFKTDDGRAYGLDFLISEGGVLEHNVWYFTNVKGGVIAYQYARRHYRGKSVAAAKDFIAGIGPSGSETLSFFRANPLPIPGGYEL